MESFSRTAIVLFCTPMIDRSRAPRASLALTLVVISCFASVSSMCAQTFGVYRELWTNLNSGAGNTLAALTNTTFNPNWPNNPASAQIFTSYESGTNVANLYGQRLRTFVVP